MNRDELIHKTAEAVHTKHCEGYRERGKPYIKETKDEDWIAKHGTNQVDFCEVALDELPQDWLQERLAGAEIAVDAVLKAHESSRPFDAEFIEEVAELLHRKWLERNATRAAGVQKLDYAALPEIEKIKDRQFVIVAIEAFLFKSFNKEHA